MQLDKVEMMAAAIQHLPAADRGLLNHLAATEASLGNKGSEVILFFSYFEPNYSMMLSLGVIYEKRSEDAAVDQDVYNILTDIGFSPVLADLVMMARKQGAHYLLLDPDKEPYTNLKTYQ